MNRREIVKKLIAYFTKGELLLWVGSMTAIIVSFLLFDRTSWLTLGASLVGVTSLIFCAKGNPAGQVLMIAFALMYGIISWGFAYYGEMITYVFMSLPMAVVSLVAWLRNPYGEGKSEVRVNKLDKREYVIAGVLAAAVTAGSFFLLKVLGTANLVPSTISVTTSFIAVYFTFRRSPLYAIGYAANDIVLVVLWTLAAVEDIRYVSVMVCFMAFLLNDIYGFVSWRRMEKRQSAGV